MAEDLEQRLEARITEFTLPSNGMHFIVMERHNAPIVACNTYADVGAFDEEDGRTGPRSDPQKYRPTEHDRCCVLIIPLDLAAGI